MSKSIFVTFEGLDGSGKSTHLRAVAERLESAGIAHCVTRAPGGTELGAAIRDVFLDPRWGRLDGLVELMLVFADRRQHLIEVIEPALADGKVVLCDRFTDSTYAYQGAGRGVDHAVIDRVDRLATGRRRPDRTVLLDLPAREARLRGQSAARKRRAVSAGGVDRLDAEELAFYGRVREAFLDLARREPERFRIADSSRSPLATRAAVWESLSDLFPEVVEDSA